MAKDMASMQDLLEDIERAALDICKKGGQPQNEDEEFDNRNMAEKLLKSKNQPSKAECNKLAYDMLDWYTSQELTHTHNSKSEIVVKTINQVWARKGINTLTIKLEGAWSKLHNAEDEVEVEDKKVARKGRKSGTFTDRLVDGGKKAVTKALVRKASRNLTDLSQSAIVGLLMAGVKSDDENLRKTLAEVMGSDFGKALCAGALSMGLEYMPVPGLSDDNKDALIEELQTNAVDAFTMPIENIVKMGLPMLTGALTPLLTGGSSEESKQIPQASPSSSGDATPPSSDKEETATTATTATAN